MEGEMMEQNSTMASEAWDAAERARQVADEAAECVARLEQRVAQLEQWEMNLVTALRASGIFIAHTIPILIPIPGEPTSR